MPNSASAKKDLRQNQTRRLRNRIVRSTMRRHVSAVRAAVKAGNFEEADTKLRTAVKKLDQAAAKGIIHKNAANRTKGRLSHLIKTAKAAPASA